MDAQMPVIDGLEATARIRSAKSDSGTKPARILALTANAYPEDREDALAAGIDSFWWNRARCRAIARGNSIGGRFEVEYACRLTAPSPNCHIPVLRTWCLVRSPRAIIRETQRAARGSLCAKRTPTSMARPAISSFLHAVCSNVSAHSLPAAACPA